MSRIGRAPITIPAGVEVKIDGHHITVKGPKGTLERDVDPAMILDLDAKPSTSSAPTMRSATAPCTD